MKLLFFCVVFLTALSCSKSIKSNVNGTYIGVFERNGVTSNVELTLTNGQFSGQSDQDSYPAICSGAYAVSGNTISFENECGFFANFDWSLILSDTWSYSYNNNVLILTKANGDKYTLTLQ